MILCESGLDWTRPQFLFFLLSKSIHFDELWDQFNPNPNYLIMTSHFKLAIPKVHNMSHPFSHFSGKEFAFKKLKESFLCITQNSCDFNFQPDLFKI